MSWIDEFAKGLFGLFAGQCLDGFQPIDFFHFYPMWYDVWFKEVDIALKKIGAYEKSYSEMKNVLPPPSNIRALLQKGIPSYKIINSDEEIFKRVCGFFARMLMEVSPEDPFSINSNRIHSESEIKKIIDSKNLSEMELVDSRKFGRLLTAAGSYVHGLYNDIVTDFGWDAFGPYNDGNKSFLIRVFPNLCPKELWSDEYLSSIKKIEMFSEYEAVEWEILFVGCHTISKKGSPVKGLRRATVEVDGKKVENYDFLMEELADKSEKLYKHIRSMNFEELKMMVLRQEAYQTKAIFDAAEMNWEPTTEMISRIKNKPLLENCFPKDKLMEEMSEFRDIFGIDVFKKNVLKE